MKYTNNTKKIKKALLKGGLVVAARGTGKTQAIFEILLESNGAIAIVSTQACRQRYLDLFDEKFRETCTRNELEKKIIVSSSGVEPYLKGFHYDVYIDEYHLCNYRGPFKGAVTSFPFDVKVIK